MLRAKHKAYLYDYHRHITPKAMIAEERFNFTNLPLLHLKLILFRQQVTWHT